MKRLSLLTVFCVIALSFSDSLVHAQPPGGRLGQGGGRQGGRGGPGGRGQGMGGPGAQQTPPLLRLFDANGDGELSSQEIDAAANVLRELDQNHDGKLNAEELRPSGPRGQGPGGQGSGRQGLGSRQAAGGRPGGGPAGGGRPGGGSAGGGGGRGGDPAQADEAFAKDIMSFDENKDGTLAKSELPEHMHEAFAIADANKDGALDAKERLVLAAQFRRNKLNPTGDAPMNAPTQGRRP